MSSDQTLNQIWAPWRLAYIKGDEQAPSREVELLPGADKDCFICRGAADHDAEAENAVDSADRANLVVARGTHTITLLNRYPYNNGHLLIAPLAHKGRLAELSGEEHLECQRTIVRAVELLETLLRAEGFNVGLNLGRVAGAGLPGHLHWHVVPRWTGDTNFMPALANVKVIPQALDSLWEFLREQWEVRP